LAFTGFEVQPWMLIGAGFMLLFGVTLLLRGWAVGREDD
jgi:hypothetical protein